MELKELKELIINETLPDDLIIFKLSSDSDNTKFLAQHYINEICILKKYIKKVYTVDKAANTIDDPTIVSSIAEVVYAPLNLLMNQDINLQIFNVSELNEKAINYSNLKNTIIICKKIDQSLAKSLSEYIVNIPTPTDWQIKDYIKFLSGNSLEEAAINWLYDATNSNLDRITVELDKINLFDTNDRQNILGELKCISNDLCVIEKDLYKIIGNIVLKNLAGVYDFITHKEVINVDIVSLSNLLLREFKNILFATQTSNRTPAELNLTDKQIYAIRQKYKNFNPAHLLDEIKFLSEIDYKVKNGLLDLSKEAGIDYIISNVLLRL